jgi:hypothetical protein
MTISEQLESAFIEHLHEKHPGFLTPDQWKRRQSKHPKELVRNALVISGETLKNKAEVRKRVRDRLAALRIENYRGSYLPFYFQDYPRLPRLLAHCYKSPVKKETLCRHLKKLINTGRTSPFYPWGSRADHFLQSVIAAFDEAIADVRLGSATQDRERKRPGPKGPHRKSLERRNIIVGLYKRKGITTFKICETLNEFHKELPSRDLQVRYGGNWLLWYAEDPVAVRRQLSMDYKRAS